MRCGVPFLDKELRHWAWRVTRDVQQVVMHTALYLIAPPNADAATFPAQLRALLDAAPIAALLLPRGTRDEPAYCALVAGTLPWAQGADCAVLVEGTPQLARETGADGLHLSGAIADIKAALGALKPDLIVGAAVDGASRHDAMSKGELEVDYVMFGPLAGAITPATRELAKWWAEAMEVPAVLSDPGATAETLNTEGCEFLALGESLFASPQGAPGALAAIARRLEQV